METYGRSINAVIKSQPDIFAILQPFFAKSEGGTKENNNTIYSHYKSQGSEYIVISKLAGTRWKFGEESNIRCLRCCAVLLFPLTNYHVSTEKFSTNEGLTGACQSLADSHQKRLQSWGDNDDDGRISLGSTNTPDRMPLGSTSGCRAAACPCIQPSQDSPMDKTKELIGCTKKLLVLLKNASTFAEGVGGFDFTGPLPYIWWTVTIRKG